MTFDSAYVDLQTSGSEVLAGSNRAVSFGGSRTITVAPGKDVVSDPVALPFVRNPDDPMLTGRWHQRAGRLHPNPAGYAAMGSGVDLNWFAGR